MNQTNDQQQQIANIMVNSDSSADQMRARLHELEARANSQTRDLQAVAQISQQITTTLNLAELLPQVVELTKTKFGLYHAHLYLYDPVRGQLVLAAGAGEAGRVMVERGHAIAYDEHESVVATAAHEHRSVTVNDVTKTTNFMPNPLLPDTLSELAVPMVLRNELIGVLDLQSDELNYFNDDNTQTLATLATQVASAVQNARLFTETDFRLRYLQVSNQIAEYLRQTSPLEGILENVLDATISVLGADNAVISNYDAVNELWTGFVGAGQGMTTAIARTFSESAARYPHGMKVLHTGKLVGVEDASAYPDFPLEYIDIIGIKSVLTLPLFDASTQVTGVIFLNYTTQPHHFTEAELSLASSIANQVSAGIQISHNNEALVANERRFRDITETTPGALYQFTANEQGWKMDYISPAIAKITGVAPEAIMRNINMLINTFHPDDLPDFLNSVNAVIESGDAWSYEARLIHADGGLRWWQANAVQHKTTPTSITFSGVFLDVTERKLAELEAQTRASEIEKVALVGAKITANLQLDQLVKSVVNLTRDTFNRYHVQIYLYEASSQRLVLAAGSGEIGEALVERGHFVPLALENSLVATAARTRHTVVVNDVRRDERFLANPLLPKTLSELVIPLLIGESLMGVLDVQDQYSNVFTDAEVQTKVVLANQIAVAV
ncbi:MAG: GAF domain-containing protein, partial [Armatimonadetes bacterium]|nr:GAF domain-containing protein [Anaerolineae bacterium]